MIRFLTTRKHRNTICRCLKSHGSDLAESVKPQCYGALFLTRHFASGTYILSDLERLSVKDLSRLGSIHRMLSEDSRIRFLNHPTRTLRRYDLLCKLYEAGINSFQTYRLDSFPKPRRFPVFIRGEDDHKGTLSNLIHSQDELDRIAGLWAGRWGGARRKIVTEFCDVGGPDGVYRKYAAFKIGDRILPRHLFFGTNWCVKSWELLSPVLLDEEREYIDTDPHANQLAEIFAIAGVDFGRIDYGVFEGKIQVWEINTNPQLPVNFGGGGECRQKLHEEFADKFVDAMRAIDLPVEASTPIDMHRRTIPLWAAPRIPGEAFLRRATRGARQKIA